MSTGAGPESDADYEALAALAEAGQLRSVDGSQLRGPEAAESGRAALRAALERGTAGNGQALTAADEARYAAWSEQIEESFRDD